MQNLRSWIASWADENLDGGVPGVCADELHERMHADLLKALDENLEMVGAHIDQSKCFDRLSIEQAVRAFKRMGLPDCVGDMILEFYRGREVFVQVEGHVNNDVITPTNGLIQGCPWSVMCVILFGTITARHVKGSDDGTDDKTEFGCFFDDKVLWAVGAGACERLDGAVQRAAAVDDALGAVWNRTKDGTFGMNVTEEDMKEKRERLMLPKTWAT